MEMLKQMFRNKNSSVKKFVEGGRPVPVYVCEGQFEHFVLSIFAQFQDCCYRKKKSVFVNL